MFVHCPRSLRHRCKYLLPDDDRLKCSFSRLRDNDLCLCNKSNFSLWFRMNFDHQCRKLSEIFDALFDGHEPNSKKGVLSTLSVDMGLTLEKVTLLKGLTLCQSLRQTPLCFCSFMTFDACCSTVQCSKLYPRSFWIGDYFTCGHWFSDSRAALLGGLLPANLSVCDVKPQAIQYAILWQILNHRLLFLMQSFTPSPSTKIPLNK